MRKLLKRTIVGIVGALALTALYVTVQIQSGNFHEIIPGEFYRSGQPTASQLEKYHTQYGIKSVINLRGENADSPWYQEELAASKALGITHLNFRMKASREMTDAQAKELVALMHAAPKPLLIHCNAGADRSGLASALYLANIEHVPPAQAANQLSLRYGHVALWFRESKAMRRSFERLEPSANGV
jgi:protein tyrosine/serine phosphatase